MLSIDYNRTFNVFVDVNVGIKNHNFNISLILDKSNIIIVMQKLKFMHEFTFAINVECLYSSLQAKLLMHNCARAKMQKHVFVAYKVILKLSRVENMCVECKYSRAINLSDFSKTNK